MGTQKTTLIGINFLVGLWLIFAPFILGYSDIGSATGNDIIVGILVALASGVRLFTNFRARWLAWVNVVLGIWLILAPFILGYPATTPRINDIIVGIIIAALGAYNALGSS